MLHSVNKEKCAHVYKSINSRSYDVLFLFSWKFSSRTLSLQFKGQQPIRILDLLTCRQGRKTFACNHRMKSSFSGKAGWGYALPPIISGRMNGYPIILKVNHLTYITNTIDNEQGFRKNFECRILTISYAFSYWLSPRYSAVSWN